MENDLSPSGENAVLEGGALAVAVEDTRTPEEIEKKAAVWDAQHRAGPSYGDLQDMLSSAVSAEFAKNDDDYAWVCDFGDDWAVYSQNGEKFQCSYTLEGDTVALGDPEPVRTQTTYVPLEAKAKNWATAKRGFTSLVERAPAQTVKVEVRMDDAADPNTARFRGYAYTIDQRYGVTDWLGEYDERIGPGASSKTLREQASIPMLRNHDPNYVFANTQSQTSQLADDGTGLLNLAALDRRQTYTNDMCISLQRGDIAKMSFSFRAMADEWNETYDDRLVRELKLYDTSIVTYPANPHTTAELQDAVRSAMGREGRSLWLADSELSVRSALPMFTAERAPDEDQDDLLDRALRALVHADDVVTRSVGEHGRARTFQVGTALLELRAGKKLSAATNKLLNTALDALSAADKQHQKLSASHTKAADALNSVLNSATPGDTSGGVTNDGKSNSQGASNGDNPIMPKDGAGPRSAALKLQREREAELATLRRH